MVKTTLLVFVPDTSSKPIVECSVVTEFTDHICVTMDAELIMFLHDLVSAYLKEKEKGLFLSFIQGWISDINETTARVRTRSAVSWLFCCQKERKEGKEGRKERNQHSLRVQPGILHDN